MKCKTKGCTNEFIQYNSLTSLCVACAIEKSKKIVAKNYRFEESVREVWRDGLKLIPNHWLPLDGRSTLYNNLEK